MFQEPQPTRFDLRWRMGNTPVRISPWFWLITLVMGWSALRTDIFLFLLWTVCCTVAILVHEFGHALTARAFGVRDVRVVLYGFGGLAIHGGGRLSRGQRILELLMGPGAGFILYGLLWGGQLAVEAAWPGVIFRSVYLSTFLGYMSFICLWWGLVNLLPVFPLDGGQVSRELCVAWFGREAGVRRSLWVSVGTGVVGGLLYAVWHYGVAGQLDLLGLYPSILFWALALGSYQQLKPGMGFGAAVSQPMEPWQQDPDWWKG